MKKHLGAVAIAGCMLLAALRSVMAAPGDADAPQQPLAKYLTPEEVAKRQKLQTGKSAPAPVTPALAKSAPMTVRNGHGNSVPLGGPAGAKKNAAVTGKSAVKKNAAAVGGPLSTIGGK